MRAALEALGIAGRSAALDADVARIVRFLNHPSQDVRTTAAKALANLGNTQAICPLKKQFSFEQTSQVKLAISAALRDLGAGGC